MGRYTQVHDTAAQDVRNAAPTAPHGIIGYSQAGLVDDAGLSRMTGWSWCRVRLLGISTAGSEWGEG